MGARRLLLDDRQGAQQHLVGLFLAQHGGDADHRGALRNAELGARQRLHRPGVEAPVIDTVVDHLGAPAEAEAALVAVEAPLSIGHVDEGIAERTELAQEPGLALRVLGLPGAVLGAGDHRTAGRGAGDPAEHLGRELVGLEDLHPLAAQQAHHACRHAQRAEVVARLLVPAIEGDSGLFQLRGEGARGAEAGDQRPEAVSIDVGDQVGELALHAADHEVAGEEEHGDPRRIGLSPAISRWHLWCESSCSYELRACQARNRGQRSQVAAFESPIG